MNKPLVSVYMAAIRPSLWMRLWDSLVKNNTAVQFEVIFVGHVKPDYNLPYNVRYIYSPTKPVQCAEIGFRNCSGEFCIQAFDDLIFEPRCIDLLYNRILCNHFDEYYLPCCTWKGPDNTIMDPLSCRFWAGEIKSPILPICGMYNTDTLRKLGGRDKRFVRSYADLDLAMRFYEQGGRAEICKEAIVQEVPPPGTKFDSGLNWIGSRTDRPKLLSYWTIGETYFNKLVETGVRVPFYCQSGPAFLCKQRQCVVQPFINDELLTKTQGDNDGWE